MLAPPDDVENVPAAHDVQLSAHPIVPELHVPGRHARHCQNARISAIRTHFQDGSQYLTVYDTNIKTVLRCKPMLDRLSIFSKHG